VLQECFDVQTYLEHIDVTFRRLGLSVSADRTPPATTDTETLAAEAGIAGGRMS